MRCFFVSFVCVNLGFLGLNGMVGVKLVVDMEYVCLV